jgi:hypothetical protein
MSYFEPSAKRPERIGKVMGDIFSAFIFLSIIVMMAVRFI